MTRPPPHPRRERLVALGLGAVLFVILVFAQRPMGIPRDESVYFESGVSYADWFLDLAHHPGAALSDAGITRRFSANHEHAALPKILFGLSHALFHDELGWTDHFLGFRIPALLFSALLVAFTFLLGCRVSSPWAGLFAAVAMAVVPRHFYHMVIACFDVPVTFAWLLTVYAYRRALEPGAGKGWSIAAGLAFGLAISVKLNAYFLPPLLVLHWLIVRGRAAWRAGGVKARLRAIPLAFPAMAILGPAVLFLTWPWMWHHTFARFAWYASFHLHHVNYPWQYLGEVLRNPPFPFAYPFVVTALTVPVPVLVAMVIGLGVAISGLAAGMLRSFRARRHRAEDGEAPAATSPTSPTSADGADEVDAAEAIRRSDLWLLVLNGLFPIVLIALPDVPIFGGVKHWLPAMPFLALLGGEVVVLAARAAVPSRPRAAIAGLSALVLLPSATAAVHFAPNGTAAYNALDGGTPGAASVGMQRQFWSNSVSELLPWIDAHARPGARIYFHEVTYLAYLWYQREGWLRRDIRWANDPAHADLATYLYHQEFRDREFEIWSDFGVRAPAAGFYLDDVPIAVVYARPGATISRAPSR